MNHISAETMEPPHDGKAVTLFGARVVGFCLVFVMAYVVVLAVAVNARAGGVRGLRYTNIPSEAPTFGGQTSHMFEELDSITSIDVLFIGSSHAYRTFDPRFFDDRGLKTFNMGTTGQTPLNARFLLDRNMDKINPRVVVLEVYWNVLTWDGVESTLDIVANGRPAPWILRMAVATRDIRAVNAFGRRILDLRRPTIKEMQPNLFVGDTYVNRGYVEKDTAFSGNRTWPDGDLAVRSRQLEYLAASVRFVVGKGIPLVLITQPLPRYTLAAMTNRTNLHSSVNDIADLYNVRYVDFNGLVALDDTLDFFDSHHLSQRGVEKFLPAVYNLLVELGMVNVP